MNTKLMWFQLSKIYAANVKSVFYANFPRSNMMLQRQLAHNEPYKYNVRVRKEGSEGDIYQIYGHRAHKCWVRHKFPIIV